MNILVTGATGFIGSHLVERLRADAHTVRCVARDRLNMAAIEKLGVTVVLGDLLNGVSWERLLDGVDAVAHLAGTTRACRTRDYYVANHLTTRRFVEGCRTHCAPGTRFVYVSSLTVVGPSRDGSALTESTPCAPVSHYGRSKLLAEEEVWRAAHHLAVTVVRPSAVYGPRDRDTLEAVRTLRFGFAARVGFAPRRVSFVHVFDLVDGIVRALTHPAAPDQTYLLGGPAANATADFGRAAARVAGRRAVSVPVPPAAAYALGLLNGAVAFVTRRPAILNVQKARELVQRSWVCSSAKAEREIGYRPTIDLATGVAMTYRWYQEQGWVGNTAGAASGAPRS